MSKPVIAYDDRIFLGSLDAFKRFLLPLINKQREDEKLPPLTEQEIIDLYLDLYNKHKNER